MRFACSSDVVLRRAVGAPHLRNIFVGRSQRGWKCFNRNTSSAFVSAWHGALTN
jgi:hypothetical protein